MSRQTARSAATRQKLLDATFECLVELGYHQTSTVAVCSRADVSRGTMLHHFPTKQDLVLAAMDDVLVRRVEEFRAELEGEPLDEVGPALRRFWSAVRGPTFFVWLELAVAARTDAGLGTELSSLMARFDAIVSSTASELLTRHPRGSELLPFVPLVFGAFNGMALDLLQADAASVEEKVELLIDTLELVLASLLPSGDV